MPETGNLDIQTLCEITPSADLEDVFLYFLPRFNELPSPRSVAEARITVAEIRALIAWFSERWGLPRVWCEDTRQLDVFHKAFASRQEMFGAMLLVLAAEVCRENASEDSVWPAVTAILRSDKISFPALFVAGQPTVACKNAIAAGARKLRLRNVIDRDGALEYFDTIKLQFGFTHKGAVKRLPEWLDGLGRPPAINILNGDEPEYRDLESASFQKLWNTLKAFRSKRVSEAYTTTLLRTSPWIRPEWIEPFARAAELRVRTFPGRDESHTASVRNEGSEPICEPVLRLNNASKPQLFLRLNEERIIELLRESRAGTFSIDGQVVDRWFLQENGSWRGNREIACQRLNTVANLRPKVLAIGLEGRMAEETDLLELGLGEPILIFDLRSGKRIDISSRFDPSRDYVLICDPDLAIAGATPISKIKDRHAYVLNSPWRDDLKVVCDGMLYWEPQISEKPPLSPIQITLELPGTEVLELGSTSRLQIRDVPEWAEQAKIVIGDVSYNAVKDHEHWQTEEAIPISVEMAAAQERIRVGVSGNGRARTVTPRISLRLRGIASIDKDPNSSDEPRWTLINRNRPLNRAGGVGSARIFVEGPGFRLYEGACLIGKVRSRAVPLRDLSGWGAPLSARSDRQAEFTLVDSVEDRGPFWFVPVLFRGQARGGNQLLWRTPKPPTSDHQVFFWLDLKDQPKRLEHKQISSQHDGLIWTLPNTGSAVALAVTYQGVRIAAYWTSTAVIRVLRAKVSQDLFALLRWLKIPILNGSFRPAMQAAVARYTVEFVSAWLLGENLPTGVALPDAEDVSTVIRDLLWNYSERSEKVDRLAHALIRPLPEELRSNEADTFKLSLSRLGRTSPSLGYSFARHKLRGDKYRKYTQAVVADMIRAQCAHDMSALRDRLMSAARECADLIATSPDNLARVVSAFGNHLDGQRSPDYELGEASLKRLGETEPGRMFISASLIMRAIERSRF